MLIVQCREQRAIYLKERRTKKKQYDNLIIEVLIALKMSVFL